MEIENNRCFDCEFKSKAVSILDEAELIKLQEGCSQITFRKGELLFKEGAPAKYIVYIRNGFVKLSKQGIGGKDFILSVSKTGAYLNIQNIQRKGNEYYFSAIALTKTNVCFIEKEIFEILLKRNGAFAYEVISYIFADEMNYFDRLVNNVQQQLPGRLANAILYFKNQVYNENPFNLNINQSELASLIGTSRESVSRIIKEFRNSGIIETHDNQITVLDEKRLEEIKMKG